MAEYRITIDSSMSAADAYAYLADLRNLEEWDPGVSSSRLVAGDQPGLDAVYEVKVTGSTLRYETIVFDPPSHLEVEATSRLLRSHDLIDVEASGSGCAVTYRAVLELQGVLRFADRVAGLMIDRIGGRAATGLEAALKGRRR